MQTLKDDKKRAAYDKYGAASQQPGFNPDAHEQMGRDFFGGGGFSGGGSGFGPFDGFGPFSGMGGGASPNMNSGNMFETLFDALGGRQPRGATRGDHIEATVGITFAEACKGIKKTVSTSPVTDCKTCTGTGLKSGAKRSTCASCGGSGTRTYVVQAGFQVASTCDSCHGAGTTIPRGSSCGTCSGAGKVRTRKPVDVDIPPGECILLHFYLLIRMRLNPSSGVDDGMMIRIPGAGDAAMSASGKPGDLLVRINVAPSKHFRRQGPNLYHDARIPLHTAVLGGRVRIPTLDGQVDVRVPGGTQQGEEMVLKGRGVASQITGYVDQGDLFVTFAVQLPR